MRLFPPTCSDSEHHQSSHDHGSIYDGLDLLAAMLGPAGYVWAASRGKRFAIHTKSIAYGTAVMVPFALHNRYVEQRAAAYSTRSDNMPVPRPVYVDRLSHFDVDNAMLLGGLTGMYIVSLLRGRPKFGKHFGWRTYAAAMSFGAAQSRFAFRMFGYYTESATSTARSKDEAGELSMTWDLALPASDFLKTALDSAWLRAAAPAVEEPEGSQPPGDGITMAMFGLGGNSRRGSSGPGGGLQNSPGQPGMPIKTEILSDGPFLAVRTGSGEPEVLPHTNYIFYSENKIADLEQEIAMLRKRRQQAALEAEAVWAWLSEQEAQYYENFPVTKKFDKTDNPQTDNPNENPARQEAFQLVDILGQSHSQLWQEAAKCDWMIADCQKRIAQEESRIATGKIEWRATCSEAASTSPLSATLSGMRNTVKMLKATNDQTDQMLTNLAIGLADPGTPMDAMAMHPLKGGMAPQKEVVKDIREHLEKTQQSTQAMRKSVEKAIAEGERRAGKGD